MAPLLDFSADDPEETRALCRRSSTFIFAGAMNPCPCGYHGDPWRTCACAGAIAQYQKRYDEAEGTRRGYRGPPPRHRGHFPATPEMMTGYAMSAFSSA